MSKQNIDKYIPGNAKKNIRLLMVNVDENSGDVHTELQCAELYSLVLFLAFFKSSSEIYQCRICGKSNVV